METIKASANTIVHQLERCIDAKKKPLCIQVMGEQAMLKAIKAARKYKRIILPGNEIVQIIVVERKEKRMIKTIDQLLEVANKKGIKLDYVSSIKGKVKFVANGQKKELPMMEGEIR